MHILFDTAYQVQLLYLNADLSNPSIELQYLLVYGPLLQLNLFYLHAIHLPLMPFLFQSIYPLHQF